MKKHILFSFLSIFILSACAEFNDPMYGGGSYGSGGYRDDDYYRRRDWERERRHEERELDRERARIERERQQLEDQRRRQREERCPSGFSPSERKCSVEERRRGCKDMRLSNGLGCVKR